jgi:hypothetical protein
VNLGVGLERTTHSMAELDVGPWPATQRTIRRIKPNHFSDDQQGCECGGLQAVLRAFDEALNLSRRLAASSLHLISARLLEIGAVDLPDSVI